MTDFDLALETQAYQALLEGHRAAPDDELIYEDMLKAKAAMEIAWLQRGSPPQQRRLPRAVAARGSTKRSRARRVRWSPPSRRKA